MRRGRLGPPGEGAPVDTEAQSLAVERFRRERAGLEDWLTSNYATELGNTDRILYVAPETAIDIQTSYEFQKSSRLRG